MARPAQNEVKSLDFEMTAAAFAKAVYEGDIVNFKLLFLPLSPARETSGESFDMAKYAYLLPDDETKAASRYRKCLEMVRRPDIEAHIRQELQANRPAQLPSDLILELADNAVRLAKYTSAAQAYEMLRVRGRMQRMFLDAADAALDAGDVPTAVNGYLIGTGLAYDYAAFPEPLPVTPDFQTRALMMHADYPEDPAAAIGMWETKPLIRAALAYMLLDAEAAARLENRPEGVQLAFLAEVVRRKDPEWETFIRRFRETEQLLQEFVARFSERRREAELSDEIAQLFGDDPRRIPASLLGRTIEPGEWWQYLKELAGQHPAAVLFVGRQMVGNLEILVPRRNPQSPVAKALGV